MFIYNFKTGESEYFKHIEGEWHDYIPQNIHAQNAYSCLRSLKYDPIQAATIVLSRVAGDIDLADEMTDTFKPKEEE